MPRPDHRSATRRWFSAAARIGLVAGAALVRSAPAGAQYPVTPTPVLDLGSLRGEPTFGGTLVVHHIARADSSIFAIERAYVSMDVRPRPTVALRLQVDLASRAEATGGDTVATLSLVDAFVQLASADSSSLLGASRAALLVGQFAVPFSLEYLTSFGLLRTAQRSQAVDAIAPRRELGVMAQAGVPRVGTLAAALVNGTGPIARQGSDRLLAVGRLTLTPSRSVAIAGKLAGGQGARRWGFDARVVRGRAVIEGEILRRRAGTDRDGTAVAAASGGYTLASFKVVRWLEPVVKWEDYRERRGAAVREQWTTYGANIAAHGESLRMQVNWVDRRARGGPSQADELIVQVVASF